MISFIILSLCLNAILADKGLECPKGHICWPKCCPEGFSFDVEEFKCANLSLPTQVPKLFELKRNEANFSTLVPVMNSDPLTPIYEYVDQLEVICNGETKLISPSGSVNFLSNGQLYVDDEESAEIYDKGFCFENFVFTSLGHIDLGVFLCAEFAPIASFSSSLTQEELNNHTSFNQKVSPRNFNLK